MTTDGLIDEMPDWPPPRERVQPAPCCGYAIERIEDHKNKHPDGSVGCCAHCGRLYTLEHGRIRLLPVLTLAMRQRASPELAHALAEIERSRQDPWIQERAKQLRDLYGRLGPVA